MATEGSSTYLLDNGRLVQSVWREHVDEGARLKCPWLTDCGRAKVRMMVPDDPAEDDHFGQLLAAIWRREEAGNDSSCRRCTAPVS